MGMPRTEKPLDIRGWFQYYGRFYRSGLYPLRWYLNRVLARWATRKYKKLKHRFRRAEQWLLLY
jgi:hypothetical protein